MSQQQKQQPLRKLGQQQEAGVKGQLTQMLPDMILELRRPTMQPVDADMQHILVVGHVNGTTQA